jgi:membrane-associated phospholipid phosphatase
MTDESTGLSTCPALAQYRRGTRATQFAGRGILLQHAPLHNTTSHYSEFVISSLNDGHRYSLSAISWAVLLFCALSVASSRIMLGMRFLSDVVAGAILGAGFGYAGFIIFS